VRIIRYKVMYLCSEPIGKYVGSSTGKPTEKGLNLDGDAVMNFLRHNKQ
jgi:hypothetical protein